MQALIVALILGVLFLGCTPDVSEYDVGMSDVDVGSSLTCNESCSDVCVEGNCFRSEPELPYECPLGFSPSVATSGCQVVYVDEPALRYPKECQEDVECDGSAYGDLCIYNLCSNSSYCSEDRDCLGGRVCHEIGVCAYVSR